MFAISSGILTNYLGHCVVPKSAKLKKPHAKSQGNKLEGQKHNDCYVSMRNYKYHETDYSVYGQ